MRSALLLPLALLGACVSTVGASPNLGSCADLDDLGPGYAFGQAGVGTCLASPTQLAFRDADGARWLSTVNADPFYAFSGGSWLDLRFDDAAIAEIKARGIVPIGDLDAHALPMDRFGGGFTFDRFGQRALVAGRLTEGSFYRGDPDRIWILDVQDPTRAAFREPRFLPVGADPVRVIPDPSQGRAYVLNALSPSVSIVDLNVDPPALLDPAPLSEVTEPLFTPGLASTGLADATGSVLEDREITRTDTWTATWLDGTSRLFAPKANGLQRYSGGGAGAYVASAVEVEVLPFDGFGQPPADPGFADACPASGRIEDPWLVRFEEALFLFHREVWCDGDDVVTGIRSALGAGEPDAWAPSAVEVVPPGRWTDLGGPAVLDVLGDGRMFLDGTWAGSDACEAGPAIGMGSDIDGLRFSTPTPVLCLPDGADDIAQPSPLVDPLTQQLRMWMSLSEGGIWRVAHATSTDDGASWSTPEVVTGLPDGAGAPFVQYSGGLYRMWLTVSSAGGWVHATATSHDGLTWTAPEVVAPSDRPATTRRPPRGAIQPDLTPGWRLEAENAGFVGSPIRAGTRFQSSGRGFQIEFAAGAVAGRSAGTAIDALEPGSVAEIQGLDQLFATATDADGLSRIVRMIRSASDGAWSVVADNVVGLPADAESEGVRSPAVVVDDDGTVHLFHATSDGERWVFAHAISTNGLSYASAPFTRTDTIGTWERVSQDPHHVRRRDDGTWEMWFTGSEGSRERIGLLTSDDLETWTLVPGESDPWTLGPGAPGTFDDVAVRDPSVVDVDGVTYLWYAGDGGDGWSVGLAWRPAEGGRWRRPIAPLATQPQPALPPVADTFATAGTRAPVVWDDGGDLALLFSGSDGFTWRVGAAAWRDVGLAFTPPGGDARPLPIAFPTFRMPRPGDTFTFLTRRGQAGRSAIDLGQTVDGFPLPGALGAQFFNGWTAAVLDPVAGMLYVASKDGPILAALDVRDDSTSTFDDLNVWDLEAALRFDTTTGLLGIHDMIRLPDGRLMLTAREPDGIVIVDPSKYVVDDARKDLIVGAADAVLPAHDLSDDDGEETFGSVGAAGLATIPGTSLLVMAHMNDNSVSVFDLSLGPHGREIAHLEDVGENPHLVAATPDGAYAVVATWIGGDVDDAVGSQLVLIDTDPLSADFLSIVGRVVNR